MGTISKLSGIAGPRSKRVSFPCGGRCQSSGVYLSLGYVSQTRRLQIAGLEEFVNTGDYEMKIREGRGIAIAGRVVRMEWKRGAGGPSY